MTPKKRSPLKHPPLRVPAQGVEEELQQRLVDFAMSAAFPLLAGVVLLLLLVLQCWGRPLSEVVTQAVVSLIVWLVVVGLVVRSCRKTVGELRNLRLGMQAERYVGQQLERCRKLGYSVFHDLVAEGVRRFNVDHVAIGPGGVFVIESKGRSKPLKGKTEVTFDGEAVVFSDGGFRDDKPIRQVTATTDWVRDLLMKLLAEKRNPVCQFTGGRHLPTNPVVVYPGWFIDFAKAKERGSRVAVTNDRKLIRYIRRCPRCLTDQEAMELGTLLGEHLRDERRHLVDC